MMRFVFLSLFSVLLLSACTENSTPIEESKHAEITIQHAKHFRFATLSNGKEVVEILSPDNQKVLKQLTPLTTNQKIIALSASMIGMLEKLDLQAHIVGVSEMKYIYSPFLHKAFKEKKIVESGYDTQLAVEAMIAKQPALILHSGFSKDFPHEKQFENAGIQCYPIFDWREETALGRAEWIMVYGFLYGKLEEAKAIFKEIEHQYIALQNTAKTLKRSDFTMSGNVYGGEWYTPAGESFFAQLFQDANIRYIYADTKGTGSLGKSLEQVLVDCKTTKLWINPGVSSFQELLAINSKANLFDAFQLKQVYCHSHNENFYWEKSAIEPHKVLNDLIKIAHPDFLPDEKELYFYRRLE
jgi:iron complex transport system substrate-binding protein